MTASDLPAAPALPDRPRRWRWGYFAVRGLIVVLLAAIAAALPSSRSVPDKFRYRTGDIARERIVAPYDFKVEKNEALLRREQEQSASGVAPVFGVDARVSSDMLGRFGAFQDRVLAVSNDPALGVAERRERMRALVVPLSAEAAEALTVTGRASRVLRALGGWLDQLYDTGIVSEKRGEMILGYRAVTLRDGDQEVTRPAATLLDRREAMQRLEARAQAAFRDDPASVRLVAELAGPFVQPNVVNDRAETEWRRIQARAAVPPTVGTVQKDELIVDANQRLTPEVMTKLASLRNLEAARRGRTELVYPPLARALLMLLFIAAFAYYLRMELPGIYGDNSMLALFALLAALVMGLAELMVGVLRLPEFTVPLALAPLVVGTLVDKRPALMFTLMLTVAVTGVTQLRSPFVPMAVMGGVAAVYASSHLRSRWHFIRATIAIATGNLAAILAWDLVRVGSAQAILQDAGWGVLNAFGAVALAFMLLPVAERWFRLTSDLTLLELSDLNRPLLRRLQLEAPGTYHHSMVVASLAESAAEGVGANPLLARVMAYYHDIGKLAKPTYFHENEPPSARSPHDKLKPHMSALIVRRHIAYGLQLAKRERLPRAVRQAIPEHHGTMVMAFFYHKALEQNPEAQREEFSYPGPRPRSRETAILMLADGIEGASRALQDPSPSRIRGLIGRIVEERIHQGQLDDCGLTLADLARIREAFARVLSGVFHVRAPYPEEPKRRAKADAEPRREPS